MKMKFKVTFYDYWHCGSGMGSGVFTDARPILDKDGLPWIPGRTMKGLIRDAADALSGKYRDMREQLLGEGAEEDEENRSTEGQIHVGNATLSPALRARILKENLASTLFEDVSSTKIDDQGIAEDQTLRTITVVLPATLYGVIDDVPKEYAPLITDCLKWIKAMGTRRHRGFGRCSVDIVNEGGDQ